MWHLGHLNFTNFDSNLLFSLLFNMLLRSIFQFLVKILSTLKVKQFLVSYSFIHTYIVCCHSETIKMKIFSRHYLLNHLNICCILKYIFIFTYKSCLYINIYWNMYISNWLYVITEYIGDFLRLRVEIFLMSSQSLLAYMWVCM